MGTAMWRVNYRKIIKHLSEMIGAFLIHKITKNEIKRKGR